MLSPTSTYLLFSLLSYFHLWHLSFTCTVLSCYPIPFLVNYFNAVSYIHLSFLYPPALLPPVAFIIYMYSTVLLSHSLSCKQLCGLLQCCVLLPIFSQHSAIYPPIFYSASCSTSTCGFYHLHVQYCAVIPFPFL